MSIVSLGTKIKGLVILAVAFIASLLSNAISAMIGKLASIPILGFLFKVLQFPFKILGMLKIPLIILIIAYVIIAFILPIVMKHLKKRKQRSKEESEQVQLLDNAEDSTVNDVIIQELAHHSHNNDPSKIEI